MYIRDEHPLRYRTRYVLVRGLRGIGIGPEIVTPKGCAIALQQSSPPLEGLMDPMTDAYTTLAQPTMAPLMSRPDLAKPRPTTRRALIPPVEAIPPLSVTTASFGTCISCG
jgi:hypothetical protein